MQIPSEWLIGQLVAAGVGNFAAVLIVQWLVILGILLLGYLANWIAKRMILSGVRRLIAGTATRWDDVFLEHHVFDRCSHLAPALVIYACAGWAFPDSEALRHGVEKVAYAYMILVGALVLDAFLEGLAEIYRSREVSRSRPIRSYIQVIKLVIYLVTAILVISTLLDSSPWAFLSGLGALTAVIMLVFKDTILGFVASIQLISNDMVRRGDWIEMPTYGADGDVIEVSLNTVKVQNWDKTISTIPTYMLVADSFRNWRGMEESGGRRIKRAVYIDLHSIKFCSEEMLDRYARVRLLTDYIREKRAQLAAHNEQYGIDEEVRINSRRLTNIGTFRAYVMAYLRNHPNIHQGMTLLVRQLPPGDKGLPIEIYAFSNDQSWGRYEEIMADIFDHILSVIPEFELQVYQAPSGQDVRAALALQSGN